MPAHSHRVGLPCDVDLARRLLSDAGYPGGRGLPELTLTPSVGARGAENLLKQWAELGATVTIVGPPELDDPLANAHMWMAVWGADYPDPDAFLSSIGRLLPVGRDDRLLRQARSLQDRKARIRLYNEIERLWITQEAALLPLVYVRSTLLTRPWVDGVWPTRWTSSGSSRQL